MKSGLQAREGLHLKRLFNGRAIPRMERSVQFDLLALATTHHGKRTLGHGFRSDSQAVQQRGFSSVGRASALQAECQRFESVNLHQWVKAEMLKS
jgi:hypothetical protein